MGSFRLPLITWVFFGILALIPILGFITSLSFKLWFQFHRENSSLGNNYQYENSNSILFKIKNLFLKLGNQY